MIEIVADRSGLFLVYEQERGGPDWVNESLDGGGVSFAKTFHFTRDDVVTPEETSTSEEEDDEIPDFTLSDEEGGSYTFKLGVVDGQYFRISPEKLHMGNGLFLATSLLT